ncbi:MAG: hypothetical protein P8077_07175, partial [Gammaproteobacteria bacterium]
CMALLAKPTLVHSSVPSIVQDRISKPGFTFATFNFNNLFDTEDDPEKVTDQLIEIVKNEPRLNTTHGPQTNDSVYALSR